MPTHPLALHAFAILVVSAGVVFGTWGVVDCYLDRRAVRRSGVNGLLKESSTERWASAQLVLLGQMIHATETVTILHVSHGTGGHVALGAVTLVCGILMLKTVLRRRSRIRMRALYEQGHR